MAIWYKVAYGTDIDAVEVERETEQSVFIKGQASRKRTDYHNYFRTRAEAVEYLIERFEGKVRTAKRQLEWAERERDKAVKELLG